MILEPASTSTLASTEMVLMTLFMLMKKSKLLPEMKSLLVEVVSPIIMVSENFASIGFQELSAKSESPF